MKKAAHESVRLFLCLLSASLDWDDRDEKKSGQCPLFFGGPYSGLA